MQGSPRGTVWKTTTITFAFLEQMGEVYAVDLILLKNHVQAISMSYHGIFFQFTAFKTTASTHLWVQNY